jgi:hypothetical protein
VSIDGSSASSTTSTRLATARTINGTSFNGTANITTSNWGTARTLWGNSVNGSGNITAPLRPAAGTRAAPAFSQSGDTASGIYFPVANQVAISTGNQNAIICQIQTVHFGGSTDIPSGATLGMSIVQSGRRFIQSNNLSDSNSDMNRQSTGALFNFLYQGSLVGGITTTGSNVAYNTTSDYRLKENVKTIENALNKVLKLNPVTYDWKNFKQKGEGFIAHELQEICPYAVTGEKDAVDGEGKPIYQAVDTSFLIATLTKAIQELKVELDDLKKSIKK